MNKEKEKKEKVRKKSTTKSGPSIAILKTQKYAQKEQKTPLLPIHDKEKRKQQEEEPKKTQNWPNDTDDTTRAAAT